MFHTAKLHGVALIPIQWGETMEHGHDSVIAWLALCDGDVKAIAAMERFLEYSGLVTWEHCVSYAIPCGKTTMGRKARTSTPKKKPELVHAAGPICPITGFPTDLTDRPVSFPPPRIANKD